MSWASESDRPMTATLHPWERLRESLFEPRNLVQPRKLETFNFVGAKLQRMLKCVSKVLGQMWALLALRGVPGLLRHITLD